MITHNHNYIGFIQFARCILLCVSVYAKKNSNWFIDSIDALQSLNMFIDVNLCLFHSFEGFFRLRICYCAKVIFVLHPFWKKFYFPCNAHTDTSVILRLIFSHLKFYDKNTNYCNQLFIIIRIYINVP